MASPSYAAARRAVVFADLCRSTQLFEQYGDVKARQVVTRALALLREIVQHHRGVVIKTIGDEIMAAFADPEAALQAAVAMPPVVHHDPVLDELDLALKVGLHFGDVLLERHDVYGDTVNVAARMVKLARPDQILTTRPTVDEIPNAGAFRTRSLGPLSVRGKQASLEVVEILWQRDPHELTLLNQGAGQAFKARPARLLLRYEAREVELTRGPFTMGRSSDNDLVVRNINASRAHAHIDYRNGVFVLVDHSTNGTYVQIYGSDVLYVHRDQTHLHGEGLISLGQRVSAADEAVRFQCVEAGEATGE